MIKISRSCTILLLAVCFMFAPNKDLNGQETEAFASMELDSLIQWLENNITKDTSIFISVSKFAIPKSGDDAKSLGEIYAHLASWYGYHGLFHPDSTVKYSEKSVEQFEIAGDTILIATALRTLAIDYVNTGALDKSNEVLFRAVDLYEKMNDPLGLANINRTIGIVASFEENWETAIEFGEKAYPVFETAKDYYKMAVTQLNLIEPFTRIKRYEEAHGAAELSIDIVNKHVPDEIYLLSRVYAYKADASLNEGKFLQAKQEAQKAFDICSGGASRERCASYLQGVADAEMALGNIDQALENYLFILKHEPVDEANSKSTQLYNNVIECYKQLQDYEAVAKYQEVSYNLEKNKLEDVINNLETESFAKYESGKKDQAIAAQQIQIRQKTRIQWLSIGFGALFALLLLGVFYNYRRTKKISTALKIKNDENELLLKEIHHRVKNNLEIVSGLLTLQSAQISDPDTKQAMLASQNRVQAMGILHQKLYQGVNLGAIEMRDYFINLSEGILDTFDADQRVKIDLAMDNLELDVDTAVPIGLIVNELLTNALKYAFPENANGKIKIKLKEIDQDNLLLEIADDGIGADFSNPSKGTGFGSQLVDLLTKQLRGTITQEVRDGTVILLKLKKAKAA